MIEMREESRNKLEMGRVPVRLFGGNVEATYYILTCEHGTTELQEPHGVEPADVRARLVEEHHQLLTECSCQPTS